MSVNHGFILPQKIGKTNRMKRKTLLKEAFRAAIARTGAERSLPAQFENHTGKTGVIALGKAGAAMARAALVRLPAPPVFALAVTPYNHVPADMPPALSAGVEVVEAGHPHPDDNSLAAGKRALDLAATLGPSDRLLALVSGGGSAVLCAPAPGVSFDEKHHTITALHRAGAPISEINAVRAALSAIKGGRLAAAANGAFIKTLIISDTPGDRAGDVASGPTIAANATPDPEKVLRRYGIDITPSIAAAIRRPSPLSPPGDVQVIANAEDALYAAAGILEDAGYEICNLGGALEGDAADLANTHADVARRYKNEGRTVAILSGGETTVRLPENGAGKGGRNTTYLLALAIALKGLDGVEAMAADTDGIDGSEANAGAFIDSTTLARTAALGVDMEAHLACADAYTVFDALGDLLVTGPTLTNVNDLRIILVDP